MKASSSSIDLLPRVSKSGLLCMARQNSNAIPFVSSLTVPPFLGYSRMSISLFTDQSAPVFILSRVLALILPRVVSRSSIVFLLTPL